MKWRTILRRTLWTLGTIVLLIVLSYAEENWRGARAWNEVRADYLQSGGVLDYRRVASPRVPDSENLAALPLFAMQPDSGKVLSPVALNKALHKSEDLPTLPLIGRWEDGERPDFEKLHARVRALYAAVFKNGQAPPTPLAQWNAVYPVVNQLRGVANERTAYTFDFPYDPTRAFDQLLGPVVDEMALAKVLAVHALLAIEDNQSGVALDDIRLVQTMSARAGGLPSLVAGLVSIGVSAINATIIQEGLARHAWNDAQLDKLQDWLGQTDYLSLGQLCIRGEVDRCLDEVTCVGSPLTRHVGIGLPTGDDDPKLLSFWVPWPQGWIDLNKAKILALQRINLSILDPASHRAYPERARELRANHEKELIFGHYVLPASFFAFDALRSQIEFSSQVALAQVCRDELGVACGLERFRLAHGSYPDLLGKLQPAFCSHLPSDLVTGQPLHYQLKPNGGYLLYSVGWNEKDDGGTIVYAKKSYGSYRSIDVSEGDWVWFGSK